MCLGDTETHRDVQVDRISMDRIRCNPHSYSFGQCVRDIERRIVEYEDKLFATVSADDVIRTCAALHTRRDVSQYTVTNDMAMIVVDALEAIDICHHQGQGSLMRERVRQFFF